jgi:multiple sugar transport system ATP-binding protein
MKNGEIQQLADPHTIYNRPVNLYVAGFIGSPSMNFLEGTLNPANQTFVADDGTVVPVGTYQFTTPVSGSTKAVLGVRPEHIVIGEEAQSKPFNQEVEIEIVEPMGSDTLAWTKIAGKPVTFRCDSDVVITTGQKILIGFDPARGSLFNAETTNRI